MPIEKLIIDGVDLNLLDRQRKILEAERHGISADFGTLLLSAKGVDALRGVLNMLNTWSDERYYKKHPDKIGGDI